jgi:hypothetical protein
MDSLADKPDIAATNQCMNVVRARTATASAYNFFGVIATTVPKEK